MTESVIRISDAFSAPGVSREAVPASRVFFALMRRDVRVMRRELPYFLVRTIMQPMMFVVVFGFILPRLGFVQGDYTTTLLPGILAVSLSLSAIQSVALPMVNDFGFSKEIEDRLLAPIPITLVASEKVVMGIIQGMIAALFVLPMARIIMGPIPNLSFEHAIVIFGITVVGAATFSALGLLVGSLINPNQIGLMFSIVIAPMIFFGCAYYPWRGLDAVPMLKYAVLINPMVYVAEGMRAALTPAVPHMNIAAIVGALTVIHSVFWLLGLRSFRRRAVG